MISTLIFIRYLRSVTIPSLNNWNEEIRYWSSNTNFPQWISRSSDQGYEYSTQKLPALLKSQWALTLKSNFNHPLNKFFFVFANLYFFKLIILHIKVFRSFKLFSTDSELWLKIYQYIHTGCSAIHVSG